MPRPQWLQVTFDERCFPVKHVHIGIGDLTVDQQRHTNPGHARKNRIKLLQIGHPGR